VKVICADRLRHTPLPPEGTRRSGRRPFPGRTGFHSVNLTIADIPGSAIINTNSRNEELVNVITHGTGALLSIVGTVALVIHAVASADVWRIVTYPVFGLTMILLYTASTLYHAQADPVQKARLKVFDHVSIYYLIAGTYTPVTIVALRNDWGWAVFGVIWALALAGTVFKLKFTGRFPVVSTILYVAMGWTAIVAIFPLMRNLTGPQLAWLLAGGIFYTGGVAFYAWRRLKYNHAIWHICVLGGTASHFVLFWML